MLCIIFWKTNLLDFVVGIPMGSVCAPLVADFVCLIEIFHAILFWQ